MSDALRIDKWLWVARFYKTRSLAAQDIGKGRVWVNGQTAKASREVRPGDRIAIRQSTLEREVVVQAISTVRGPAAVAQALYVETPESLAARAQAASQRPWLVDPAQSLTQGRPTKRDRRQITQHWDERWSASLDD